MLFFIFFFFFKQKTAYEMRISDWSSDVCSSDLDQGSRGMSARIIDGKLLSDTIKAEVGERVKALKTRGIVPGLAVVLVGEDPASQVYVRNKAAACEKAGLHSQVIRLAADIAKSNCWTWSATCIAMIRCMVFWCSCRCR